MAKDVTLTYSTYGCCARFIDLELAQDRVKRVKFIGGCKGNAQGIATLVEGLPVDEVIERLRGIECRNGTSCPDQLSQALASLSLEEAG